MRLFSQSTTRITSIMTGHPLYQLMPSRNTLTQSFPNCSFHMLSDILDRHLRLLDGVSTNTNPGSVSNGVSSSFTLRTLFVEAAEGNTWSRSARRSRRRIDSSSSTISPTSSSTRQPTLTCSVRVIETSNQADEAQSLVLEIQWLYGTDRTLFESFVSHLWRKVGDDLSKN
jgi:hypothetical protein